MRKLNFRTARQLSALLVLVIITASCTTILKAGFESDGTGSAPNPSLPGNPAGDALEAPAALTPAMRVVPETMEGSKALQYANINLTAIGGHSRWTTFRAKTVDLKRQITYSWVGKMVSSGNDIIVDVALTSSTLPAGASVPILRLKMNNNNQLSVSPFSFQNAFGTPQEVGSLGQGAHTIVVSVNTNTRKFGITLFRSAGGGAPSTFNGDILVPATAFNTSSNRPSVSFGFDGSGGPSDKKYLIDDLKISRATR